ncbi:putative ankyrin repeat protein [Penicillium rolfsii]|nr:putative ankyrin repeat protein [Penicillium rolfsii]
MGDILLLFYFCSNQDEKRNSAATILRSLVYQMLTNCRDLFASVSSYFETPAKTQMILSSAETLWVIFRTLLQSSPCTVFCVLDGLDECDEASSRLLSNKFRDYFSPAHSGQPRRNFNLVVVSRKVTGLEIFSQVKLDPDNDEYISSDIKHFISASIQELERVPYFDRIREEVKLVLLERAQGTFLWVGFVIGELSKKNTCSGIMESLNQIPPGLDGIYSRMLRQAERSWRTESTRQNIIPDILRWVTVALRPLTLQELTTAMALTTEVTDVRVIRDQILICEPILKIQSDDQVNLVHQSAREYLLREKPDDDPKLEGFRIKAEEAHAQLGRTCLDVVERSNLSHKRLDLENRSTLQNSPLLKYAALYWPEHLGRSSTYSENDLSLSRPVFRKGSPLLMNWWYSYMKATNGVFDINRPTLFFIACIFGIASMAQKLARNSRRNRLRKSIYQKDEQQAEQEAEALRIAALKGDECIMQLLLTQGADINAVDKDGDTALFYAIMSGNETVVQLLLAQGADINAVNKNGITALSYAIVREQEAIVQLLLAQGADINAVNKNGIMALFYACIRENEAVVRLLLKQGADINAVNKNGITALISAIVGGNEAVVHLLLKQGADINAVNKDGITALIPAIVSGNEAVVHLLLKQGADINAVNKDGDTALFYATMRGNEAVVHLLLKQGADINAVNKNGITALIPAIVSGNEAVVQLLLAQGADIKAVDKDGNTALSHAIVSGNETVVHLLLKQGADINAVDKDGDTALISAIVSGNEAVVHLLLKQGADINAVNKNGDTALFYAIMRGNEAVVHLLLKQGADINAVNKNGYTALFYAVVSGQETIVQLLLAQGADINAVDKNGSTALIYAVKSGQETIVQLLVAQGANIDVMTRDGKTALIMATEKNQKAIVHLLLACSTYDSAGPSLS